MSENSGNSSTSSSSDPPTDHSTTEDFSLTRFLSEKRTDFLLFFTRILTLVFGLHALFFASASSHQRALLAAASTSALRLHQRLPPFRFSRDFLALVVLEDAFHYLLYCLLFSLSRPLSLALLTVSLFAFLHSSAFALVLLEKFGNSNHVVARSLQSVVTHQRSLLQTAALAEIALMPSVVIGVLSGHVSLMVPFLYYRFLVFRYSSRRNPYSRQMFYQIRQSLDQLLRSPSCPMIVKNIISKGVDLISRLAPPIQ